MVGVMLFYPDVSFELLLVLLLLWIILEQPHPNPLISLAFWVML